MVRRRRPPRLRPHRAVAQPGGAAAGAEGAGRPGRRLHAVELPDQPDRAQARRGAGHRLLVPRARRRKKRPASPAALLQAFVDAGVPRRHGRPGVRRPGRDLQLPDPASGHPQGDLHRLDAGRQAAGRAGRRAHEARDDGAGRPCAGDRRRGRRRRAGRQGRGRAPSSATPARSASRRPASSCTTASATSSPRRWSSTPKA